MRLVLDTLLVVIIVVSMIIGSSILTRSHDWGDDYASYIMQAQSILNGNTNEFVEHNTFTIYKSSFQIGPVAYPWGYPIILTPPLYLRGVHPLPLKVPGLFFFAGFLVCLYLLMKTRLPQIESLLIVSLFAFNPVYIKFLDQILSDIPFLCVVFLGLLLITDMEHKHNTWMQIILGAVLYFAFLIRTTGIVFFASFMAYQVLQFYRKPDLRKDITIGSSVTSSVFLALWGIFSWIFPNGQGSYFAQLKDLNYAIFIENIRLYFYLFASFFGDGTVWMYIYYGLVLFFLMGAWKRRSSDLHLVLFFSLYLFAMILWPERQGVRFIFPLLPLFFYFVFQGCRIVIAKLPDTPRRFAANAFYVFWLLLIALFLYESSIDAYTNIKKERRASGPFDTYSLAVYNYIKTETPPDSVIIFFKPRAMRLFTGHDSVMITECERLNIGDYVVVTRNGENDQIQPDEIGECGFALTDVLKNRKYIIYKIIK